MVKNEHSTAPILTEKLSHIFLFLGYIPGCMFHSQSARRNVRRFEKIDVNQMSHDKSADYCSTHFDQTRQIRELCYKNRGPNGGQIGRQTLGGQNSAKRSDGSGF